MRKALYQVYICDNISIFFKRKATMVPSSFGNDTKMYYA